MTTARTNERRGKASHRADLQGELLNAACDFVARHGHEELSMRRLAEEVGVSSGAPYHHFADRRALLLAVALLGYRRMLSEEDRGWRENSRLHDKSDARERLAWTLRNVLQFASGNSRLFTLMYESELVRPKLDPEIKEAQNLGFIRLRREVNALNTGLPERELGARIATIWSAIFGFALQRDRQMIRTPEGEPEPDELADAVVRQALRLMDD